MFCPTCGKSDQTENTYCRQCGEYLPDFESGGNMPKSPAEQFKMSLIFNVLSAVAAVGMATALLIYHAGMDDVTPLIWSAISLFYVIGIWQTVSFFNNWKLRKRFIRKEKFKKKGKGAETGKLEGSDEPELILPEADPSHAVPSSVVEETTRELEKR
ncbi:MAG: hypothetical protein J5I65_07185 [Aridibacter famidurans]|nr:hypothetical protein [Aridibacter famidurans]